MTNIKTFMDYTCPFSYLGFSILDKLRKEEPQINYIWYPYVLSEDTPLEGNRVDTKFDEQKKSDVSIRLNSLGKEYGINFNNLELFFNTNRAHKASLYARDNGYIYDFSKQLFSSVFEKGENIADKDILNKIAEHLKLNVDEMNEKIDSGFYDIELNEAKKIADKYDVTSVPTFIVNDEKKVTDLKNYSDFKSDLLK